MVKMRNRAVEMRNRLKATLVPVQNVTKRSEVRLHAQFFDEIMDTLHESYLIGCILLYLSF